MTLCIHLVDDMTRLQRDRLGRKGSAATPTLCPPADTRTRGRDEAQREREDRTYLEGHVELPGEVVDAVVEGQTGDHALHL